MDRLHKPAFFFMILTFLLFLISGCANQAEEPVSETPPAASGNWRDAELKDVSTGETFRISDFRGKIVLLESFAVWCPACRKQQDRIKELHEKIPIVSVSLDTDPNEDEDKVREHINTYGYGWHFAISPPEFTRKLIGEFGISVVNAPWAPVVLICKDQSARLMGRGVKSVDKLKSEIRGCQGD